jgi:hypothetical protein
MGMGVSFMFMWVTSILEMWLYQPVFITGIGKHYQQFRVYLASEEHQARVEKFNSLVNRGISQLKTAVNYVKQQWLQNGWPLIKNLLHK